MRKAGVGYFALLHSSIGCIVFVFVCVCVFKFAVDKMKHFGEDVTGGGGEGFWLREAVVVTLWGGAVARMKAHKWVKKRRARKQKNGELQQERVERRGAATHRYWISATKFRGHPKPRSALRSFTAAS